MNNLKTTYSDTCEVYNVDKNQTVTAEILDFYPKQTLSVALQRSLKLVLRYNEKFDEYQASMAGFNLTSKGPTETVTYQGRK